MTDVELLKAGRQFRLSPRAKLVLGRNQDDNEVIKSLARPVDTLLRASAFTGPLGLVSGHPESGELAKAAAIVASYGKGQEEAEVEILCKKDETQWVLSVAPMERKAVDEYIVQ